MVIATLHAASPYKKVRLALSDRYFELTGQKLEAEGENA
jgi:hypothetical protein